MADGRQKRAGGGDGNGHEKRIRAHLQPLGHVEGNGGRNERGGDIVEHIGEGHGHQHERRENQHHGPAVGAPYKQIGEQLGATARLQRHADRDHGAQ